MNLFKLLATVSLMTIFSRISGFIRDSIIARIFGIGISTDLFFIAFKLPNLLRSIFAEGALSQALIPILVEYKIKQDKCKTRTFIAYISGLLIIILIIITAFGVIMAPLLIAFTAPGFIDDKDKFTLATRLLRIMFPYILLISLSSFIGMILNTWNYFLIPAIIPSILNISIIIFSLFITPYFNPPIIALAWAVIFGGILQLLCQLPHLKKVGMLMLPRINFYYKGSIRLIKQIGPAILGVSISQISLIINSILSSFLVSGSISWMYYADRLMEFPSGVLGVTLGTILLPSLSKNFIIGNYSEYRRLMDWGLRLCCLLAFPSAVALGILAKPIIVSLFQYGKFTAFDTKMTQYALIAYSVGLIGLVAVKVLASGFYSCQDIKTPIKIAIFTLFITQLMNVTFISSLKHVGLSLSAGLAACLNAVLLYWQLYKQQIFYPYPGWIKFLLRLFIAVITMATSLIGMLHIMPEWSIGTMPYRLLRLVSVVIIGIVSYYVTLILLGFNIIKFMKYKNQM